MPPSSHYLNLLNLNQAGDEGQAELYAADDLTKELELFTNSNFLDQEAAFYPTAHGNFVPAQFDLQQQQQSPTQPQQGQTKRPAVAQDQAFNPTDGLNLTYLLNQPANPAAAANASALLDQPDLSLLTNTGDKRRLNQTDFDQVSSIDSADAATPGGLRSAKSLEEEDKRRRNTQASARFRVKKKQREQALQENARQMNDRCSALESRVKELELENKWLRNLLKPADAKQASSVFGQTQESS